MDFHPWEKSQITDVHVVFGGRYESYPNVLLWIPNLEQRHDDLLIVEHSSGKMWNGWYYEIFSRGTADQLLMENQMPGAYNSSPNSTHLSGDKLKSNHRVRPGGDDRRWNWLIHKNRMLKRFVTVYNGNQTSVNWTITAKQKVRQDVQGLYAVCR